MEMAKSNVELGCGRMRLSATMAVWWIWWFAILTRFSDLLERKYRAVGRVLL